MLPPGHERAARQRMLLLGVIMSTQLSTDRLSCDVVEAVVRFPPPQHLGPQQGPMESYHLLVTVPPQVNIKHKRQFV